MSCPDQSAENEPLRASRTYGCCRTRPTASTWLGRATAADPALIALRDRVEFDFRAGRSNTVAELELELTDGRRLTTSYDSGVPASDITEQGRRLEEKFTSLAEPILGGAKTRDLIGEIGKRKTLMFNGYGDQVAQLYTGMDLRKFF